MNMAIIEGLIRDRATVRVLTQGTTSHIGWTTGRIVQVLGHVRGTPYLELVNAEGRRTFIALPAITRLEVEPS